MKILHQNIMENENTIKELIETGSDITGSIGGAFIGGAFAGPAGIIIGGVSGPLLTRTFLKIGSEIKQRILGNREEKRIGAVYYYAIEQISKNIIEGKTFASKIIDENSFGRNASEEFLEGVIVTAQKAYEEKKIKHIGQLFANIFFLENSDLSQANFMNNLANQLSYRQFCLLNILHNKISLNVVERLKLDSTAESLVKRHDVLCELFDLKANGLVKHPQYLNLFDDNTAPKKIDDFELTTTGMLFYEMLCLNEIESNDIESIVETMNIN
jgi:hypothetical protein